MSSLAEGAEDDVDRMVVRNAGVADGNKVIAERMTSQVKCFPQIRTAANLAALNLDHPSPPPNDKNLLIFKGITNAIAISP
jgi:hypothetical protein